MPDEPTAPTRQDRPLTWIITLAAVVMFAAHVTVAGQTTSAKESIKSANAPSETPQPATELSSAYQPCPSPVVSPISTGNVNGDFSQLTVLFLASGVAFFIALLAWSDQIRGIDKDIRELEAKFQDSTGIAKQIFLRIVEPNSPDDRLQALFAVTNGDRIKGRNDAEVLQICTAWHKQWESMLSLSSCKYYAAIALTIVLFAVGAISIFVDPTRPLQSLFGMKVQMLLLMFPAMLVAILLVIIVFIAERERALRALVKSVSDKV